MAVAASLNSMVPLPLIFSARPDRAASFGAPFSLNQFRMDPHSTPHRSVATLGQNLRSQATPPGAVAANGYHPEGVDELSGMSGMPGLESLHSLSGRGSAASPTPTVGTAIGSHGATSPASSIAEPQQRLRRPMNSFLLYSNEHRKPGC